jgi:hypothetical protein
VGKVHEVAEPEGRVKGRTIIRTGLSGTCVRGLEDNKLTLLVYIRPFRFVYNKLP